MLLNRLMYRIKQFFSAFRAQISYSDVEFIRHYLSKAEQVLFYKMRRYDQKHTLSVAHQCLMKCDANAWIDRNTLVRVALLHDIGKSVIRVSLLSRVLYVLIKKVNKGKFITRISNKNSFIRLLRQFYVLLNHSELGAKLIHDVEDNKELIEVVQKHHQKPLANESKLLPIIREIDRNA